jgi:hypothetical protein
MLALVPQTLTGVGAGREGTVSVSGPVPQPAGASVI